MKILLVNAHGADLAYGGAERYVDDLRAGLQGRGQSVTVLSAFPTIADYSPDRRELHGVDWRESRARRYRNHVESWLAPAPASLQRAVAEVGPDLVHTSNLVGIGTGIWERDRRLGLPTVHTLHDYGLLCPRSSLIRRDGTPCQPSPLLCGLRSRRLARWAPAIDAVIGVSAHVLRRHAEFFTPDTARRVIHPPLARFPGPPPPAPGSALATLGYIGALSTEKGIPALLSAAPALQRSGLRLRVAGDGPLRDAVAGAEGLEYLGPLLGRAVPEFLSSCDAGIVPSAWEEPGLTFVALEWLSAGRPVITSGRGGLKELEPLGGVLRCPPTAAAIERAAARLTRAEDFGRLVASVPSVAGRADMERWIDDHLAVYEQAMGSRPRANRKRAMGNPP